MSHPAFGGGMGKPPHVHYTLPPGASPPPGYTPPPSVQPKPTVRPSLPSPSVSASGTPAVTATGTAAPSASGTAPTGASGTAAASAAASPSTAATGTPTPYSYPHPPIISPAVPEGIQFPSPEPSPTPAPGEKVKVRADSLTTNHETGISTFRGNVVVNYGPITVSAEELSVDQKNQVIFTDTDFTFTRPDPDHKDQQQVITGTGLRYHYDTQQATIYGANLSTPAQYAGQTIYIRAKKVDAWGQTHFEASDATFTTCDEILTGKVPHYHVVSRSIQYFAGDKIVAWDDKIYINGHYVFWLPVWVIPLHGETNSLDMGRTDIEGFYLRTKYDYTLPALNHGYWLNRGRLMLNLFEKKGVGTGFEHYATWGYDAASYAYFYGLVTPDTNNLIPPNAQASDSSALIAQNEALFGLNGLPFQDRIWGVEHRQRLPFGIELDGRYDDHNIYDPITPNFRDNTSKQHLEAKQSLTDLGGLNYDLTYDSSQTRGNQVPTQLAVGTPASLAQSVSTQLGGNLGFQAGNTNVKLNSTAQISHSLSRQAVPQMTVQQVSPSSAPTSYTINNVDGPTTTNVNNTFNATSQWGADTNSTVNVPYRININQPAPATPAPSGIAPLPVPSASPWDQQAEPEITVTHNMSGVGTLTMDAYKFLDLTQQTATTTPQLQQARINSLGKFDKLPELTFQSQPLLSDYQPVTLKLDYGRFFEYSSFKVDPNQTALVNSNFPGPFIDRLNPEVQLASKGLPLPLNTKIDFGGTGYRQFFYSTHDAQYSIDEHAALSTNWTSTTSTNFDYTNNITPDKAKAEANNSLAYNNSPFQQDSLSLSKQTMLTGALQVQNAPWITYNLRSGYDYQNQRYQPISSDVSWRSEIFGHPLGLTLNGQYNLDQDVPYLVFEKKTLNVAYLPHIPTFGLKGTWQPVSGTFTLRSSPDVFGGSYGSDNITPGWQFDNTMGYDFEKGMWTSLANRLYIIFGHDWRSHVELVLGGGYDTTALPPHYEFTTLGITKDLHDFVLSFLYDRQAQMYSVSLSMVAFPSMPLSFTSNSFNRTSTTSSSGLTGLGF
ncbi:MAG TPA: LptA/OstA family protein [Oscillatoriaceae cyanobacterium]